MSFLDLHCPEDEFTTFEEVADRAQSEVVSYAQWLGDAEMVRANREARLHVIQAAASGALWLVPGSQGDTVLLEKWCHLATRGDVHVRAVKRLPSDHPLDLFLTSINTGSRAAARRALFESMTRTTPSPKAVYFTRPEFEPLSRLFAWLHYTGRAYHATQSEWHRLIYEHRPADWSFEGIDMHDDGWHGCAMLELLGGAQAVPLATTDQLAYFARGFQEHWGAFFNFLEGGVCKTLGGGEWVAEPEPAVGPLPVWPARWDDA